MAKTKKAYEGFTEEERAAMKDRAAELKRDAKAEEAENDLLAKIAEMNSSDRAMAERIHAVMKKYAPSLAPRLYYGMPAYAKDGKVLCFFKPAAKFKTRYATFGFNDPAMLDDGAMWPVEYALTKVGAAEEKQIAALIKKAVS
jgi:uncharacterized protein YdhG (YjbR/CyaY superfamily)